MPKEQDRAGRFFLKPRGKHNTQYICWYDSTTRQTTGITTGTADIEEARRKLYEHALKEQRPTIDRDAQLAAVMQRYYIDYAQHLPSAHVQRAAQNDALEVWNDDPDCSALDRKKQLKFVDALRDRGLSDWTIDSRLNRIWAAMNWYQRDNVQFIVPAQITAEDWKPVLVDNDQVYSLEELGALFNACTPKDSRYTREHWWRFLVLAVGTCSRVTALLELTWDQVDLRLGRIRLNPDGRRQTKKRRATVPIAPTLAAELSSWERDGENVITYYGKPLATREFFDLLAETAGVTGGPNVIRHTARTWLAEVGVPDAEADIVMGHKAEGSATGKRYIHRRPEYLRSAVEGIELLYAGLTEFVERPFKGRELLEQPEPDCPITAALRRGHVRAHATSLHNCLRAEALDECSQK